MNKKTLFTRILVYVLLFAALICAIVGTVSLLRNNHAKKLVSEAVYLTDPVINAEYEGRIVALTGELTVAVPVKDPDLELSLNTPVAFRQVDILKIESEGEQKNFVWRHLDPKDKPAPIASQYLTGKVSMGDYAISDSLLYLLPRENQNYRQFNEDELEISGLKAVSSSNGDAYISQAPEVFTSMPSRLKNISKGETYYENDFRVSYSYYNSLKYPVITLVGYQKDGALVKCDLLTQSFFDGRLTPDKLKEQLKIQAIWWIIVPYVLCGLILAGLIFLLKLPQKTAVFFRSIPGWFREKFKFRKKEKKIQNDAVTDEDVPVE